MKSAPSTDLLSRLCARSTVMVAAHPDDETVGMGSCLPRLREAAFLYVTDGAPRDLGDAYTAGCATQQGYARVRREELYAALALAGIGTEQVEFVGLIDREAALHLTDLSRRLAELLRDSAPEVVITHPYEGGHPDHDATAFAVHAACRLLERRGLPAPTLVEMASYHNRNGTMHTGEFLPDTGGDAVTRVLSRQERTFKRRLFNCYTTQERTLRHFSIDVERFRPAPRYNFECAPHNGPLLYELFGWEMTGRRWCRLAGAAMDVLGLRRERTGAWEHGRVGAREAEP